MTSRSMSPRRRHILSSINPDIAPVRPRPPRPRSKSPSRAAQLNETSSFTHGAAAEAGAAVEPSEPPRHFTDAGDANTSPRQEREHEHQHGGRRHRRRRSAGEDEAGRNRDGGGEDEQQHRTKKPSRFRFKSKSSKSSGSGSRRHHSSRSYHDRDKDRGLEEDRGEQDGLEPRLGRVDDKREVRREPANAHDDDRDRDADDHDGESASSSRRDRHHHRRHHDDDNNNNNGDNNDGGSSRPRRHHHRHKRRRHHHKSNRRTRSLTPPNPHDPPPLDPEAAFRESLFDAMADDEGAAYWEAVYGQPIHVYGGGGGSGGGNTQGELEQMNDDEYAAHVRQKMWEKTHEGLLEERARREERRRQKAQKREGAAELTREMERSLRRGEERRRRRAWQDKWERYVEGWDKWNNSSSKNNSDGNHAGTGGGGLDVEGIPWPVKSGRQADIEASAVREFFATAIDPQDVGEAEYLARLKNERVRWHPDKIQQRLGGKVDEGVMRNVTAVFQVVDKLWSDARSAPKSG